MFVLKHILWIIITLYIYTLLPLVCNATTEIKDNWMEDDENIDAEFLLKPKRRLLDSGGFGSSSKVEYQFFIIALVFLIIVAAYIKCCIAMARSMEEEETPHRTFHPPPACRMSDISAGSAHRPIRLPRGSRPLAPPRTSTSIILSPEERQFEPLFIGIPNPLFNISISNEQERRDRNTSIYSEQERRNRNTSMYREQERRDRNTSIYSEQERRDRNISIYCEQIRRDFNMSISNEHEERDDNPPNKPLDLPPNYDSAARDEICNVYHIRDDSPYDDPPPKYSEI